jgi:hypothetical protein
LPDSNSFDNELIYNLNLLKSTTSPPPLPSIGSVNINQILPLPSVTNTTVNTVTKGEETETIQLKVSEIDEPITKTSQPAVHEIREQVQQPHTPIVHQDSEWWKRLERIEQLQEKMMKQMEEWMSYSFPKRREEKEGDTTEDQNEPKEEPKM